MQFPASPTTKTQMFHVGNYLEGDQHYSLFVGLLFGFFCFGEGDGVGRMIESGGVPSDSSSGKQYFFMDKALFLKVGRETLKDTRVGSQL